MVEYRRSEAGFMFPTFNGKMLSWTISSTLQDEQEGFPRLRTVIRAMAEKRPEQLEQERKELVRASFDRMFGHNARKVLEVIEQETQSQA